MNSINNGWDSTKQAEISYCDPLLWSFKSEQKWEKRVNKKKTNMKMDKSKEIKASSHSTCSHSKPWCYCLFTCWLYYKPNVSVYWSCCVESGKKAYYRWVSITAWLEKICSSQKGWSTSNCILTFRQINTWFLGLYTGQKNSTIFEQDFYAWIFLNLILFLH